MFLHNTMIQDVAFSWVTLMDLLSVLQYSASDISSNDNDDIGYHEAGVQLYFYEYECIYCTMKRFR